MPHDHSTSTIERPVRLASDGSPIMEDQQAYLDGLRSRFNAADALTCLDALRGIKVLVVGEAIIDEYQYCTPDAMSNKSPTLSARFDSTEVYAGGVDAVGNLIARLTDHVHVLAGAGTEDNGLPQRTPSRHHSLRHTTVRRPDGPTVCKRRFVHGFLNQKLFELTFLNDRPIPAETERDLLAAIDAHAPAADAVIVVDFGHGFLTPPIVHRLRERSTFLAVNAQMNSSNRGFNTIRKYEQPDYISVDENEIRLPFGDRYGSLECLIARLAKESKCRQINVTLGSRGTLYFDGDKFHAAPVFTDRVVDAIGAGDALLAITSLLIRAGAPSELVPFIGNCVGGLMTQIVGHRSSIDRDELARFITTLLH